LTRDTKEFWMTTLLILLAAVMFYVAVSLCAFAYRHPWMTDTQRHLHLFDALAWRTIKEQGK